jgi:hypothetical protein
MTGEMTAKFEKTQWQLGEKMGKQVFDSPRCHWLSSNFDVISYNPQLYPDL